MTTVRPRPCPTCPYRKDVPSGIWDATEYNKLPLYDGETWEQPLGAFHCHSTPEQLCAGWVGCHDMDNALSVRLIRDLDPAVYEYKSPVPLFSSGEEAAEHGLRDLENPSPEAEAVVDKLEKIIARRKHG
jgi:hypothetical protein